MAKGAGVFVGRERELRVLENEFKKARSTGRGRLVLVRGRRRVGKSRLVEEFLKQTTAPSVFFSATKGRAPEPELAAFADLVGTSGLPAAPVVASGARFDTWDAALGMIAGTANKAAPSIVVVDELPYLFEQDRSVEGALQTAWDRDLQHAPVLLIVIGSDLSMMAALTEYGRPLFGRPTRELHVAPLSPAEIADMTGLDPARTLDAYLIVGGFPLLAQSWGRVSEVRAFLERELADPTSPVIVSGERIVTAEFPPDAQPRAVLSAIGAGERTFTTIGAASGVPRQSLERALQALVTKQIVERRLPLSSRRSRQARYSIIDPYLRFWLRFIEGGLDEIERGRSDLVTARVMASWPDYRGRAIESVVREAVTRMLPSPRFGSALHVGSYWTRAGDIEVDLVGASENHAAPRVEFVGSIKWRDRSPFDGRDLAALVTARGDVPGADDETLLVGASRAGYRTRELDVALTPDELIEVWR